MRLLARIFQLLIDLRRIRRNFFVRYGHPGESPPRRISSPADPSYGGRPMADRDPVRKPVFVRHIETWMPAFAGMTSSPSGTSRLEKLSLRTCASIALASCLLVFAPSKSEAVCYSFEIASPANLSLFSAGERINFEARGNTGCVLSNFQWTVDYYDNPGSPPVKTETLPNKRTGSFRVADPGSGKTFSSIVVKFKAGNLPHLEATATLLARMTRVNFRTDPLVPSGAMITIDGDKGGFAPAFAVLLSGKTTRVVAPEFIISDGQKFNFDRWSDGGARSHNINVPETEQTFTAYYAPEVVVDTTPPLTSNVEVNQITPNSAVINWNTNEPARVQVRYGESPNSYGNATPLRTSFATSHSETLANLDPDTRYHFILYSEDASGNNSNSTEHTFKTNPPPSVAPSIIQQPVSQTVILGHTATFNVTATGTPSPTYQWKKNGQEIPGAEDSTYTTPLNSMADNGSSYTCEVTNSAGQVTSAPAQLTVILMDLAPVITEQPADQAVKLGEAATFRIAVIAHPEPSYQWQKNGAELPGATAPTYTTPPTRLTNKGEVYSCVITNSQGRVTSKTAALDVIFRPGVLQFSAAHYSGLESETSVSIQVLRLNGSQGTVSVEYRTEDGTAKAPGDYEAIPKPLPTPNPAPTPARLTFKEGETEKSFTLTIRNDFIREPDETLRLILSNPTGGATLGEPSEAIYTIIDDDENSQLPNVTLSRDAFDPNAGETLTINLENVSKGPAVVTKVEIINSGEDVVITLHRHMLRGPNKSLKWDGTDAQGEPVSPGTYIVRTSVETEYKEYRDDIVEVTRKSSPLIVRQPVNQVLFDGDKATFAVHVTGYPAPTFQWKENGVDIPDATEASYTIQPVRLAHNGNTYRCAITNEKGKILTDAALLTVTPRVDSSENPAADAGFKPFNNITNGPMTIKAGTSAEGQNVQIVDIRGRLVRELRIQGGKAYWDGKNDRGEAVVPDIYILVLKDGSKTHIRKVAIRR